MKAKLLLGFFAVLCTSVFAQNAQVVSAQIQDYLKEHRNELNLSAGSTMDFLITDLYYTRRDSILHAYLAQTWDGVPIKNFTATAALIQDEVRFFKDNFIRDFTGFEVAASQPALDFSEALNAAARSEGLSLKSLLPAEIHNKANSYLAPEISLSPIEINLVYWQLGNRLILCYDFALDLPGKDNYFNYKIDAATGELVDKLDYTRSCSAQSASSPTHTTVSKGQFFMPAMLPPDASAYNVFTLPVESPNHGDANLILSPEVAAASPYGWHDVNGDDAAEYTYTRGNNVYAYQDEDNDDEPGYSPDGGTGLFFDFPFTSESGDNLDAAITNLFYINNRIHDVMYLYGFDEPAGNFQFSNYGNGGFQDDGVMAEARDGGGTNNANFSTPPDGFNPRMQMYLWTDGSDLSLFSVESPGALAGDYVTSGLADFGGSLPAEGISEELVVVTDGIADPEDGCTAINNSSALNGKIAVIRRGTCTFVEKVLNAQNAGAVAVVIVNNAGGMPIAMGGSSNDISIPAIMIRLNDGNDIISALEGGTVVIGNLHNPMADDFFDSSFDNSIVIHEYSHGISTRLTGGPSNSGCLNNEEQMGEGWSDFFACMLTMDMNADNPAHRPMATYANGEGIDGNGIRPVPYDTNFAVNSYTYNSLANSSLTVPHGIGFVWCTMLWDLNWAFINEYGFDSDIETGTGGNNMVLQLVTTALKLQPCNPGFVDGRDAILEADELHFNGQNQCLIWKVFARRGLGYSASQGSSNSIFDQQASFESAPGCSEPAAPVAGYTINESTSCTGLFNFADNSLNFPQSWLWDFGDGNTSAQANPTHQYTEPGTYNVSLLVENEEGESEVSFQVEYYEVSFDFEIDENSVAFTNLTEIELPMGWFFGDGTSTYDENPVHEYSEPGTYSAKLLVSGTNGQCSETQIINITSVGIEEVNDENLFALAPNPARNITSFTLTSPAESGTSAEVYSIEGKLLLSKNIPAGSVDFDLDIRALAPASYTVLVRNAETVLGRKTLIVF